MQASVQINKWCREYAEIQEFYSSEKINTYSMIKYVEVKISNLLNFISTITKICNILYKTLCEEWILLMAVAKF